MSKVDELKKKRTAAKGWATRAKNALNVCIGKKGISKAALVDAIKEVDLKLQALDSVQSEYEVLLDEADIEEEIESASVFREEIRSVRVRASELVDAYNEFASNDDASSIASSHGNMTVQAKLPKLTLPKFSGKILDWPSFWDQFLAIVDSSDLAVINKFTYLQSLLEGEAADAIAGLKLTADNYDVACGILTKRFGREELVRFSHIQELLNISPLPKQASVIDLRKLHDKLLGHIRGLENLGIGGKEYGVFLTPLVLASLPSGIRLEWAKVAEGKEGDIDFLIEFLNEEIEKRERSNTFRGLLKTETKEVKSHKTVKSHASVTALKSVSYSDKSASYSNKSASYSDKLAQGSVSDICDICGRGHSNSKCWDLVNVNHDKKVEILKKKGLCFRCLGKGHIGDSCLSKCGKCQGNHHFLLCKVSGGSPAVVSKDKSVVSGSKFDSTLVSHTGVATVLKNSSVIMQVVPVLVNSRNGAVRANVLLDSGSDRSYVSSELVRKAQPSFVGSESVSCATFGSAKASGSQLRNVYALELKGLQQGRASVMATEIGVVSAPLRRRNVPSNTLKLFSHLRLAEDYCAEKEMSIDILIGLDWYWQLVRPEFECPQAGLVAQNTVFGWMLSGSVSQEEASVNVSHQLLCMCDLTDSDVRKFWEIDVVADHKEDSSVLKEFEEQVKFENGRYVVALPWKNSDKGQSLVDNYEIAVQRLKNLSRKLDNQPELQSQYNEVLSEMEHSGIIEEVPHEERFSGNPIFYLPHRPVVRELSTSTKVRPVFDASVKGVNNLSLNDCMDKGPNLIPNLVAVLIKFRKWPVALVADIQKAFLQIAVRKQDQDVHRFLWLVDGAVRVMRIVRVPFGNRSSPMLLNATIKHHLEQVAPSKVVDELKHNLYVDDWLTGADTEAEAKSMVEEASSLLLEAGMVLTKWGSNKIVSPEVSWPTYNLTDKSMSVENMKILGLQWNRWNDSFSFKGIDLDPNLLLTKRMVLSLIARLFDPLGFLSPFLMTLKCLFQELWKLGIEWDAEIPENCRKVVETWLSGLSLLKDWEIPRAFSFGKWKDVVAVQLHGFGDASEKGYGACVYVVLERNDGTLSSTLVLSKAKVAPLKKVTLPRLELLGAVVVAQLLEFVRGVLDVGIDNCFGWTDSSVVLSWIKGDSAKWKPFVANRTAEIQRTTNPSQWSFCKGTENPADLLTRGISAESLKSSQLWLRGPSFLLSGESQRLLDEYPLVVTDSDETLESLDEVPEDSVVCASISSPGFVIDVERFGCFQKSIAVMAWVLRFIKNCRSPKQRSTGELSFEELRNSKLILFRSVQNSVYASEIATLRSGDLISKKSHLYKLSPFLDNDGLLRVRTRLDFADLEYEEKYPIIIPKGQLAEQIVVFQHVLLKHAGVNLLISSLRSAYWIIGLRRLAKRVKRFCFQCQRLDSPAYSQVVAPLPGDRVKPAAPFSVVGIDHAGPLFCADSPGRKFYILLITCAVVRAVHLELVDSLGVEDCICAFRKFASRRGMPSIVYSDNARTFQAANTQLKRMYSDLSPDWRFIVPRAPWWGGWWERLVRSTKTALRKAVGVRKLTRRELETVLIEIEACVNSRPLVAVPETGAPLTPAHFLIGRSHMYEKQENLEEGKVSLIERKVIQSMALEKFWQIWSKNYLRNLPVHGSGKKSEISVGSLVLVRDDGQPRLTWPIAVVTELLPGRDQIVRSCKVRFKGSELIRPIQKLHKLEYQESGNDLPSLMKNKPDLATSDYVRSRYGRKIRNVERLTL